MKGKACKAFVNEADFVLATRLVFVTVANIMSNNQQQIVSLTESNSRLATLLLLPRAQRDPAKVQRQDRCREHLNCQHHLRQQQK
jgi:hypothetical protein